jgi:hypothetical protein
MKGVSRDILLSLGVWLLCLLPGFSGTGALAGFSDGLVGKGKTPGTPQPSQEPATRHPLQKAPAQKESEAKELLAPKESAATGLGNQITSGSFDVMGLRLGMMEEEAVQAIQHRTRELNGKLITFEVIKEGVHQVLVQDEVPQTRFVALSDGKSVLKAFDLPDEPSKNPSNAQDPRVQRFIAAGQIEVFELQFPNIPNQARVSVLTRLQRLAPAVHPDTIRGALIKKYGQPTIDDRYSMVWLLDQSDSLMAGKDAAKCRGVTLPPGTPVGAYDYSITAIKGCGEQLTVQMQGTLEATMMIQTTLYSHQRLIDEREATQKASLSRFGLAPEQTQQAPAPQF